MPSATILQAQWAKLARRRGFREYCWFEKLMFRRATRGIW
jgi:hypothetical protein